MYLDVWIVQKASTTQSKNEENIFGFCFFFGYIFLLFVCLRPFRVRQTNKSVYMYRLNDLSMTNDVRWAKIKCLVSGPVSVHINSIVIMLSHTHGSHVFPFKTFASRAVEHFSNISQEITSKTAIEHNKIYPLIKITTWTFVPTQGVRSKKKKQFSKSIPKPPSSFGLISHFCRRFNPF